MEGKQHHTGVTTMDSKLTFGRASEGCVHEVAGLKPPRWAVTERLAKQFPHASSSAGFLTLCRPSNAGYCFLFPPRC